MGFGNADLLWDEGGMWDETLGLHIRVLRSLY
jgi:hypothetical protein